MKTPTLESCFQHLQTLRFPEGRDNDELADWIVDLTEFDSHVDGIVVTRLAGAVAETSELIDRAIELRLRLEQIVEIPDQDRKVHRDCKDYYRALKDVVNFLVEPQIDGKQQREIPN